MNNSSYMNRTTKKMTMIPAIILVVLGIIVCVFVCIMVLITTGMPNSIAAHYTNDMLSVIAGSPLYPPICGLSYLVVGIIVLKFSKRQGKGSPTRIVGIVFMAVYIAMFLIFVLAIATPSYFGFVAAGLIIAIINRGQTGLKPRQSACFNPKRPLPVAVCAALCPILSRPGSRRLYWWRGRRSAPGL